MCHVRDTSSVLNVLIPEVPPPSSAAQWSFHWKALAVCVAPSATDGVAGGVQYIVEHHLGRHHKMAFAPAFRFEPSSNELTLRPSAAAVALATKHRQQTTAIVRRTQRSDVLEAEARARASEKGDVSDEMVLAETELQFGQYWGQTFRWLLENDVGYVVSILASHQKEREGGMTMRTPLMSNKDALASYARLFPPMSTNEVDDTLLGFGEHAHRSYKSLYNARDRESRT
ncbi:hypothetical protein JOB18_039692 [Solea senegalensis]|uniref:Uncharacterized protein n=1 Tax=Solea senegalensis TaxID=28829 RepID=A0AAV6R6M8_SOLSE|nr:hypothetical protein JOB18_039692 [Solea senegalensis]